MKDIVIDEKIVWKDEYTGTFTQTVQRPIKNAEGELIGTKNEVLVQLTTKMEIEEGLNQLKERVDKNRKEMMMKQNQIDAMGIQPNLTVTQRRLKADLQKLGQYEQYLKIQKEIEGLRDQLLEDDRWVVRREAMLECTVVP